jgi:hypothetical protein
MTAFVKLWRYSCLPESPEFFHTFKGIKGDLPGSQITPRPPLLKGGNSVGLSWFRAVIALPGLQVCGFLLLPALIAPSQFRLDDVADVPKEVLSASG